MQKQELEVFYIQLQHRLEQLMETHILQETTELIYFKILQDFAFDYVNPGNDKLFTWGDHDGSPTGKFLRKLWNYWVLMEPFESKKEIQLLKADYLYDTNEKNIAKKILHSPIVFIEDFDCYVKPEVNDLINYLREEDNAASFAWFWYRVFDMTKVHESLTEFLGDVQKSHFECLIDRHNSLVVGKLIQMAEEDYKIFQEIVDRLRGKDNKILPEIYELKRMLNYWIALLPLPVDVMLKLKKLEITSNYLEDLFFIIENHWKFLRALNKRYLQSYYNYIFLNRRRRRGMSDIVLNTLPEAPRPFREFIIEVKLKCAIKI